MRRFVLICLWVTYLTACLALAVPVSGSAPAQPAPPSPAPAQPAEPIRRPHPLPPTQPAQPPAGSPTMVPVLLYHDLGKVVQGGNGAVVDPADFDWQMAWLQEHGYTPVTPVALADWVAGKGALPDRPVLITFDDGYTSAYTEALPILKRHGMRAVLFLITDAPADAPGNGMLTWPQVRSLAQSGVFDIQGHTHAAHDSVDGKPLLLTWTSRQIADDYAAMLKQFAAAGLNPPVALAYPFGRYNQTALTAYKQAGVRLAFTVERGYVHPGDDPLKLKRQIVWPGVTRCQFAALVTGQTATCK